MKRTQIGLVIIALVMVLGFSSCKKADATGDIASPTDHSNVSSHMNASIDDAANVAGNSGSLAGKTYGPWVLVGATLDSINISQGIITISYDGTTIVDGKFTRTGTVRLQLENFATGTHWIDQGAKLDLTFTAVKYTNVYTSAVYQYDGTQQITNVTGGLAWKLLAGLQTGTITHRHTGTNITVKFPDGSQRAWNFNRLRTFSNDGATVSVAVSADQTEGGYNNVDAWGTNRKGNAFYNQIVTPIVFTNNCNSNYRDPVSGEDKHYVGGFTLDILFGVNAAGVVTTACPDYGFKVTFTNRRGQSESTVIRYWY